MAPAPTKRIDASTVARGCFNKSRGRQPATARRQRYAATRLKGRLRGPAEKRCSPERRHGRATSILVC